MLELPEPDEIWAIGLRNPWKFSFDSETNDLWIADVGQENVEEINKQPSATAGLNYGWRCYEGNAPYNTTGCAAQATMTFPYVTYSSASGSGNCSITGGYVYRGTEFPNFVGKYIRCRLLFEQNVDGQSKRNTLDSGYFRGKQFYNFRSRFKQ